MVTDIQTRGFDLTNALEQHVRHRLDSALHCQYPRIRNLQVRLSDINGPRGGADKRCSIHIGLPRLRDVVVEDTGTDMYAAVSRAVSRATNALNRRLSRRRALDHRKGSHAATPDEATAQ